MVLGKLPAKANSLLVLGLTMQTSGLLKEPVVNARTGG